MEGLRKRWCENIDCSLYSFVDYRIEEWWCDKHSGDKPTNMIQGRITKSDMYAAKLLRDMPFTTTSGVPITIHNKGYGVKTWSTRWKKGGKAYSYYMPMDYPSLFGWDRSSPEFNIKLIEEGEVMPKLSIGDYVYVEYTHKNGTVIGDRGGHVGRWTIKMDDGDIRHASSRDCTVIIYANKESRVTTMTQPTEHHFVPVPVVVEAGEPTLEEKVDLIMEHLGIEIERVPSSLVVTRVGEDTPTTEETPPEE